MSVVAYAWEVDQDGVPTEAPLVAFQRVCAFCCMVLCLENAILSWQGNLLQAQVAAAPEQAGAPAIVLHIGELPAQVQLSRSDVAALSLQALADIWRVGLP